MPWDDDISGAFPQLVFHPDAARANCSILQNWIILCIALHFGSSFGPANWEPVSWARCELAAFLFKQCAYVQALNTDVLTMVKIEAPHGRKTTKMTQANHDEQNPPLDTTSGSFDIHYHMYVDDNLSACIYEPPLIKQMVAASIEAIYLLLGYPGTITQPILPAVAAWDKMVDRPICENRISLGVMIRTYRMVIATPVHKAKRLLHLLDTTWHKKRKSFQVLEGARLLGNLIHLLFTCPWLRCSFYILLDAMREALRKNYLSLLNSPEFKALQQATSASPAQTEHVREVVAEVATPTLQSQAFQDLMDEPDESWLNPPSKQFAQHNCLNSSIAKRVWRTRRETFIPTLLRDQIDWIRRQTQKYMRGETKWERPISHIIPRMFDILGLTDASIKRGIGGWCPTLKLWWQISWDEMHPDVRKTLLNEYLRYKQGLTCVNVLELVGIVVTMMAIAYTVMFTSQFTLQWQPLAQICGDNKQANCWAGTKTMRNEKARALSKIISNIQMISTVGFKTVYITGPDNWIADDFSRKDKEKVQLEFKGYSPSELLLLQQAKVDSRTLLLRRFRLTPASVSLLVCAILRPNTVDLPEGKPSEWGQIVPGDNIMLTLPAAS
jgi:hypothetical protein